MVMVRFKSSEDHYDALRKVRKMKKLAEELEECLEETAEQDYETEYRGGSSPSYRHEYDDEIHAEGRYGYRRGMRK